MGVVTVDQSRRAGQKSKRSVWESPARGFYMVDYWVKIKVGYAKGMLAQVEGIPDGGDRILVKYPDPSGRNENAIACYTLREVEFYQAEVDEESLLVSRIVLLRSRLDDGVGFQPGLDNALKRRVKSLYWRLRALQRANGHWRRTALTIYTGGVA